eukprot:scaffold100695_cov32-Tisochrysis_lutea.AAC.7
MASAIRAGIASCPLSVCIKPWILPSLKALWHDSSNWRESCMMLYACGTNQKRDCEARRRHDASGRGLRRVDGKNYELIRREFPRREESRTQGFFRTHRH